MKRLGILVTVMFLLGISLSTQVGAQDTSDTAPKDPFSGDLLSRTTLTGDWGGLRNDLAAKGVTLDMTVTQVGQGVVNGGKSGQWQYGGRGNMTLNLDSQKLGLWPGGFFNLEAEGNWASSVNPNTGAFMAVNTNQIYPWPASQNFNVPAWNFAQFLSHYLGLYIGKLETVSGGDDNEFAHGKGDTQFMNLALNVNPAIVWTVPYSTLGTGVIILPTQDPKQALINLGVMQTNGDPRVSGFSDINGNQLTFAGEGRVRTDFFGLTGHQLFGATFSNKDYTTISQNIRVVVENRELEHKKGSWNIHYNFDQYLYEPKKGSGEGIGIFGRFGASDGNPNPMAFFYSLGLGGKGVIPNRENDRYGFGFYYIDNKSPKLQGVFRGTELLRDEYGFEWFYNIAITPWLQLTPDLQVVRGAQKNQITIGNTPGPLPIPIISSKSSVGTATILGIRLQMVF